ncbi:MAG: hypothetical protein KBS56_04830 [Clostridiales bacterium]|nr:hypothetical protein [Candidatus Crickella equi]
MSKRLFAAILSVIMSVSFMPAAVFAAANPEDVQEFGVYTSCKVINVIEPLKDTYYSKFVDATVTSLVDKASSAVKNLKFDESKTLDENRRVADGIINNLFESIFNHYKDVKKAELDLMKTGASDAEQAVIATEQKKFDTTIYDTKKPLSENYYVADLLVNECKINLIDLSNPSSIKAAKITQKNPSADKKGKIKVKFGVKTVGDAKIAQYQIYRSTSKNFKKGLKKITVKISDPTQSTVTYTDSKGLKKGKKYYYKVRGVVDGKTYTKWSGIKSIKRK